MELPQSNSLSAPLSQQSFSLSTLLLSMTVCSVWLAVLVVVPALGVCSAFLLLPAMVRTVSGVNIRKRQGLSTTASEKLWLLINSALAMLGALLIYLFFLVMVIMTLTVLAAIFGEVLKNRPAALDALQFLVLGGAICGFFLAQVPAFYFLFLDWPRAYNMEEGRFLTRWEVRQMEKSRALASPASTKNLSILAEKKRLCPNCYVPGMSAERPCPVCGNTGPDET